MPGVHRIGDATTGHGCPPGGPCTSAPPTTAQTGSSDVLCNGIGVVRKTVDTIVPHPCLLCETSGETPCSAPCAPHSGTYQGNSTVFINNQPIQVVGSSIDCTPTASVGSSDVFAPLT